MSAAVRPPPPPSCTCYVSTWLYIIARDCPRHAPDWIARGGESELLAANHEEAVARAAEHARRGPDAFPWAYHRRKIVAEAVEEVRLGLEHITDWLDSAKCPYYRGVGKCETGCYSEPRCMT